MKPLAFAAAVLLLVSCRSAEKLKDAPPLAVSAYQKAVYNGSVQPIELRQEDEGAPLELRYFTSLRDLEADEGGRADAPSEAGVYFVRIRRPEGAGYAAGSDMVVEYHIEKAPVTIVAEALQEAVYNGSPKSVAARSEPSLGLSAVYYPTREARDAAGTSSGSEALRGLARVERAPIEPGTYYVTVYYPGDANYQYAKLDLEFIIHPAPRRSVRQ